MADHPFYISILTPADSPAQPRDAVMVSFIDNRHTVSWVSRDLVSLPQSWVVQHCDAEGKRSPSYAPGMVDGKGNFLIPPGGRYERSISADTYEKARKIALKAADEAGKPAYLETSNRHLGFGLYRIDVEPAERHQREQLNSLRALIAAFDAARNITLGYESDKEDRKRLIYIFGGLAIMGAVLGYLFKVVFP